jgi:hypothetical protein
MTTLREAAQAVLDRWDSPKWEWHQGPTAELMYALRAALEQPEQDAVIGTKTWHEDGKVVTQNLYASDVYKGRPTIQEKQNAAANLKVMKEMFGSSAVPEQPEQEPMAWIDLRRLHAVNQELLEALKEIMSWEENDQMTWAPKARSAIAKAKGKE